MDRFFTENKSVMIFRDADAVSLKRPARYFEIEQEEMRRNSSISPQIARQAAARFRGSLVERENNGEDKGSVDGAVEKGSTEYRG